MQKSLKLFSVFSLLLVFVLHSTGLVVGLLHEGHHSEISVHHKELSKSNKLSGEHCDCSQLLGFNNGVLPEISSLCFLQLSGPFDLALKKYHFYLRSSVLEHLTFRGPPSLSTFHFFA
ncbi:hypothetical protein D3C87_406200 [compost metagenome]